jgi:hypothetical protein
MTIAPEDRLLGLEVVRWDVADDLLDATYRQDSSAG